MLGALFALVSRPVLVVPVAVIAVREIGISIYRVYWGRRGLAVPASRAAKLKTLLQSLAVGAASCRRWPRPTPWLGDALLWISAVVAVTSAVQYLWAGRTSTTSSGTAPS